jgi:hypothetical protein
MLLNDSQVNQKLDNLFPVQEVSEVQTESRGTVNMNMNISQLHRKVGHTYQLQPINYVFCSLVYGNKNYISNQL